MKTLRASDLKPYLDQNRHLVLCTNTVNEEKFIGLTRKKGFEFECSSESPNAPIVKLIIHFRWTMRFHLVGENGISTGITSYQSIGKKTEGIDYVLSKPEKVDIENGFIIKTGSECVEISKCDDNIRIALEILEHYQE